MSLWVYLIGESGKSTGSGIFVREDGSVKEISRQEWDEKFPGREPVVVHDSSNDVLYSANITHNLGKMAKGAGIYLFIWRPEETGVRIAKDLAPILEIGLRRLRDNPKLYKQYNPENGWGNYEGFVSFVERYLAACQEYPEARIEASR